jgi:L-2-hydroxyglutarate oxidase LhgO
MDVDCIVVGAGVVGLAIALDLAIQGHEVIVLEKNDRIGEETSSRNSEVIHAGIYYPANSLKAMLCVKGKELLYKYCNSRKITHKRIGKLIVACDKKQVPKLDEIISKGKINGVNDLTFIEREELCEIEPQLNAVRAIRSPSTGIVNSHQLMVSFQADIENHDGIVSLRSPFLGAKPLDKGIEVSVGGDEPTVISCRHLINSGGLSAQSVSNSILGLSRKSIPSRHLSRGCYFSLNGKSPFQHLIYPLPNNEGLGVHLTLDIEGQARFGPDTEWVNCIDYKVDPDRGKVFYSAIREYYPELEDGKLVPDYAGIRPKITGPGELAGDFAIHGYPEHGINSYTALYGIESPGLTSSMAIANTIATQIE